jgi:hypothetical protein
MIQIYADGVLCYDSRLEDYDLRGLKTSTGVNKGGTAEITMPPDHPAYNSFISYKTIVEIYRDNVLKFRGRALYPVDDFYKQRTIQCEGELCFFQDAVSRPYVYIGTPENVIADILAEYNTQVETFKQFKLGTITVTDPNDYIRLESESPETMLDTVNKLIDRCGGYIVFTTDPADNTRVLNWYAQLSYRSRQEIEFGENLLNFNRTGANTELATAILPYGAQDQTTGLRVTIESVNNGIDYIVDEEARALRGFIIRPVTWDDVTMPENLLKKAREYLAQSRNMITTLELSALDLSYVDKDIDTYQVGDFIRVKSKPHGVDEDFLLTERTEDMLNPAESMITLGKDKSTLTGADVAGDLQNRGELHKVTNQIKTDFELNTTNMVQETEKLLTSLIEQTSVQIKQEVSEQYVTNGQLTEEVSTNMTQYAEGWDFNFNTLSTKVDENDAEAREQFNEIHKYITFKDGEITLGSSDSAVTLTLENDRIVFSKNGVQFGWWDGVDFHTGNIVVEVNERAQFGNFAFIPRSNGSLSFLKVGG